jgi:hypothetical protein
MHGFRGLFALVFLFFDWSPGGDQIMGLAITNRPDTRRRGSGLIVLIDLPIR